MQVQRWMSGMQVEFKGGCHNAGSKVGVIMQIEFKGGCHNAGRVQRWVS